MESSLSLGGAITFLAFFHQNYKTTINIVTASHSFTQFSTLAKTHTTTAREPSIYLWVDLYFKVTQNKGTSGIIVFCFKNHLFPQKYECTKDNRQKIGLLQKRGILYSKLA